MVVTFETGRLPLLLDNIIFSLQKTGGISVYWSQLLQGLLQSEPEMRCIERPDAIRNNLHRRHLRLPTERCLPDPNRLPLLLARYLPCRTPAPVGAIFHSSYYRTAPGLLNIVTVHDFTYERMGSGFRRAVHRLQKARALRQAHRIICISESTRQDLVRYYPDLDSPRAVVIPQAAAAHFTPLSDEQRQLPEIQLPPWGRFILYVGDRSPYKQFPAAVEAVACLDGAGLVAVGGREPDPAEQRLLAAKLPGRFLYLHRPDDLLLNRLYNNAFCLLYPSAYEGFGIPPLEAMQAGCPVVAVRNSSIPEVCGDAALLAASPHPALLLELLRLLESPERRQQQILLGYGQAARFSWRQTVARTRDCYCSALEEQIAEGGK